MDGERTYISTDAQRKDERMEALSRDLIASGVVAAALAAHFRIDQSDADTLLKDFTYSKNLTARLWMELKVVVDGTGVITDSQESNDVSRSYVLVVEDGTGLKLSCDIVLPSDRRGWLEPDYKLIVPVEVPDEGGVAEVQVSAGAGLDCIIKELGGEITQELMNDDGSIF